MRPLVGTINSILLYLFRVIYIGSNNTPSAFRRRHCHKSHNLAPQSHLETRFTKAGVTKAIFTAAIYSNLNTGQVGDKSGRQVESATSNSATTSVNSATTSVKSAPFANRIGDNFGHIGDNFDEMGSLGV